MLDPKSKKNLLEKKQPKNASELRKSIGVKSTFGKTLIDLYKEGK